MAQLGRPQMDYRRLRQAKDAAEKSRQMVQSGAQPSLRVYGDVSPENVDTETLDQWMTTVNPALDQGAIRGALDRYVGFHQGTSAPEDYMASQRVEDISALENAGLLVFGELGPRSLDRRPTAPRYYRSGPGFLSQERNQQIQNYHFSKKQEPIYADLVAAQNTNRSAPTPAEDTTSPSVNTSQSETTRSADGLHKRRFTSMRDRRRQAARYTGPSGTLRQRRLAQQMGGFQRVPRTPPAGSFDPYKETFWEWGREYAGTDKAGNAWSVNDLGIQY